MTNESVNRLLGCIEQGISVLPWGRRRHPPRTILVIRWGSLGDIIVAIPAFHALRKLYPEARLVLLTTPTSRGVPGADEVLKNDTTFDEIIVYYADESAKPGFLRHLRLRLLALDIDLGVAFINQWGNFGNLAKYQFLLASVGVRRFVGFQLFTSEDYTIRQAERHVNLLRPLGNVAVESPPWLSPCPDNIIRARELIGDTGGQPLIIMHCGSKPQVSRWRREWFAETGRRLAATRNALIALTGSQGERELTEDIAHLIGAGARSVAGRTATQDLIALVSLADLVISNNTGVMHVAYALDRPLVAIFGGRDEPMVWMPYGEWNVVLRQDIECSPCGARDLCPLYDYPECLSRITVDRVCEAAEGLLDRRRCFAKEERTE